MRTYTSPVIEMTKATDAAQPAERPVPPRTINLAIAAVCAQVAFAALYAILMWPLGDALRRSVIDANAKLKKPKLLCDVQPGKGCLDSAKVTHSFQIQTTIGTVLIAAMIVLVAMRVRRGIRSGRTLYIAISVLSAFVGFVGSPLAISAAISAGPVLLRIATTLAAVSAVAALVLLFLPQSRSYFDQVSPRPQRGEARQGGLFRPRPPAQRTPPATARSSAASRAQAKDSNPGSRSKTRATEAAIAHGAELARSRAKAASKSRRTEL